MSAAPGAATLRNAVCLCADREMLVPALFVAASVRAHSRKASEPFDVAIISTPGAFDEAARSWASERQIQLIDDLDVSATINVEMPNKRLTTFTLVKLLLAGHFADRYDKILYLDCDLTIHDDVSAAFAIDTAGHALAAHRTGVIFAGRPRRDEERAVAQFRALGMSEPFRFLNAGVMLIDVGNWNAANLTARVFDFIRRNPEVCDLVDEDALNGVLDGNFASLSILWNARAGTVRGPAPSAIAFIRPAIVHYSGHHKPWKRFDWGTPFFADRTVIRAYRKLFARTPWAGWVGRQWTLADLRKTLAYEVFRFRQKYLRRNGRTAAVREAQYSAALRDYLEKESFVDIEQGVVAWRSGVLCLTDSLAEANG